MIRFACIKQMEIISEASNHISQELKSKFTDIAWAQIVGMRNVFAHEYFGIDPSGSTPLPPTILQAQIFYSIGIAEAITSSYCQLRDMLQLPWLAILCMGTLFQIKIPRDQSKINVNDTGEFIWWSNHLGINLEELLRIVERVGNSATNVRKAIHDQLATANGHSSPTPTR